MKTIKLMRDMGIAITIIAGLCMLGSFLVAGATSFTHGFLNYYEPVYFDDYYTNDLGFNRGASVFSLGSTLLSMTSALSMTTLVMAIPALVAGIVAIRHADDAKAAKSIFGWSLAGAICTGIAGSTLVCALCIILCVFARQTETKKTEPNGTPSANPIDALRCAAEPERSGSDAEEIL